MEWNSIWPVLAATGFTFAMTAAGAAVVFLFGKQLEQRVLKAFMGFAGGVMIAASVWSLLLPAMEEAMRQGKSGIIPAAGGFALGGVFFLVVDFCLQKLHAERAGLTERKKNGLSKKTMMLFSAVTLHNIPEGMAVGVAFAMASANGEHTGVSMVSAIALAIGIGIQNFPEGAAIALPLRNEKRNCIGPFLYGAASGIVEPVAAVLTLLAVGFVQPVLPWMLSFAAGAMIYVVVEELIPEAHMERGVKVGTMAAMAGFLIMMALDVILGKG